MRRWSVPRRTQPSSGLSARRGPPGSQKRRLMDSPGAASAYPSSGEGQFIFSQPAPDQDLQTRPADGPTERRRKSENSEMLGRGEKTGNRETDCESPSLTMLLNAAGTCRLPCEESPVGSECVAGHVDRRECRTSLLRLIRPTRLGAHSGPRESGRSAAGPACYPGRREKPAGPFHRGRRALLATSSGWGAANGGKPATTTGVHRASECNPNGLNLSPR